VTQEWDRPEHYGGEENPFEPIKIIEHYGLGFHLGNALKYILRAGAKPYDDPALGAGMNMFKLGALKDLRKAYTYIGFEIRRLERERGESSGS
jgi:hypothetical protein